MYVDVIIKAYDIYKIVRKWKGKRYNMGKIQLKIPPFFAYVVDPKASDWVVLESDRERNFRG